MVQIGLPEQFQVTDFLDWHKEKRLILNPNFQRRAVWSGDIKSYLINSILRGFPMPTVYIRSQIDTVTQQAVREVVDGQQRIRTILEFATGQLRLNKRAEEFAGLRYDDLEDLAKHAFLAYSVSVEHLINTSDVTVLEIFKRLNTYSVPLNGAELRNAEFNGEFKFAVRNIANQLGDFWQKYAILSVQSRLRMLDDELTAELFGVLVDGIKNGGRGYLRSLYSRFDSVFPDVGRRVDELTRVIDFVSSNFSEALEGDLFSRPPQFVILFAAVAHKLFGLEPGDLRAPLPSRDADKPIDAENANANLARLTTAVSMEAPPEPFAEFALASRGATIRTASRDTRFRYVWQAISASA